MGTPLKELTSLARLGLNYSHVDLISVLINLINNSPFPKNKEVSSAFDFNTK